MLFVDDVIAGGFERFALLSLRIATRNSPGLQPRDDAIDFVVEIGRLFSRSGNNQRRPRLVDQDAVHFVDDREAMASLHVVREFELHVVAQVVEAKLIIRAVGDVAAVRDLAFGVVQLVLDHANRHAKEPINAAHPLGVAPRQIVVHRDDVNALAFERIEIGGQGSHERLAFAGLHLGDHPLVENRAADELHVEVPHVEHAAAGLPHDGKCLREEVVERHPLSKAFAELRGLGAELFVAQCLNRRFERVDLAHDGAQTFEFAFVLGPDDLGEKCLDHLLRRRAQGIQ